MKDDEFAIYQATIEAQLLDFVTETQGSLRTVLGLDIDDGIAQGPRRTSLPPTFIVKPKS